MKKIVILLALVMPIIGINRLNAQNTPTLKMKNPYTLVYEGAITENVVGQVNIHPVSYKIKDINIVANV